MAPRAPHLVSLFSPPLIARSAAGLIAFAFRRPALFLRLLRDGVRDRKALVRLLRLPVDVDTIRRSPLFDREWYREKHPELASSGMEPELHYFLHEVADGRWASPAFSGDAYLELNPEVRESGVNPLVHYELYGRFIGCPATPLDANPPDPVFPSEAKELELVFGDATLARARTAVFATFSPDGQIAAKDLLYLRALREVCDNIVLAANSPLLPAAAESLRGIVSAVVCRPHGGYDFGSYRMGLHLAREHGWLEPGVCRELVFANASCYAPVRPFAEMFRKMERRKADFWGITFNTQRSGTPHLQSFFLVFRQTVLASGALDSFFAERPERASRNEAINLFEIQLTDHLRSQGFVPTAFVRPLLPRLHEFNPTTRPLDLLLFHRVPMVKVKALRGETSQPPERILAYVRRRNPELASVMRISEPPSPRSLAAVAKSSTEPDSRTP